MNIRKSHFQKILLNRLVSLKNKRKKLLKILNPKRLLNIVTVLKFRVTSLLVNGCR